MEDVLQPNDPHQPRPFDFDESYFMSGQHVMPNTLSRSVTQQTLLTYNQAALRDISNGGQFAHSYGLTDYALSIAIQDILRRARMSHMPWESVLADFFNKLHRLGHQVTDTPCAGTVIGEEEDHG
jgi:hypothetical protein